MKKHWFPVGLAIIGICTTCVASGQEQAASGEPSKSANKVPVEPNAASSTPQQVQVQVEFVEMSHEALTKLLFLAKPQTSDATALRQQVQDMVAKNEAKVLETQIVVAKNGQKATSESIHEFIYPTEYAQPELPCNNTKSTVLWTSGPVPTAFETRNLGGTLEVEPTIGNDARLIDLRFVPELVWHTGDVTWHEGKDQLGNLFHVQMPDIYTLRLNTALTLINNQYTLAGVISPKDAKGEVDMTRKVMVFVKCDVLTVK